MEEGIVPSNWAGQVQVLKNRREPALTKNGAIKHSAVSNSDGSSLILVSQGPKLKAWIQGVIHCKSQFQETKEGHL